MAAARDQAARILRTEPDTAEGDAARDAAVLADQLRTHLSEETARRHAETPAGPGSEKPAVETPATPPRPRLRRPPRRNLENADWSRWASSRCSRSPPQPTA